MTESLVLNFLHVSNSLFVTMQHMDAHQKLIKMHLVLSLFSSCFQTSFESLDKSVDTQLEFVVFPLCQLAESSKLLQDLVLALFKLQSRFAA